ncbi:MAG: hypothetical protein QOE45_2920 [Frankiaceae bacterium]|nr:hypothetical protein [Frankiaceae bacterium]
MRDGGVATNGDWYTESIDRVEGAGQALHRAVEDALDLLRQARSERLGGAELVDIVGRLVERGGRGVRLAPTVAYREFERAMTAYRAGAIRSFVDDDGLTYSEIAAMTGVSRQMIARLYRAADEQEPSGG